MGLTEKTLELNITHEILAFGQGIWQIFWALSPRPRPVANVVGPPLYAAGLSLQQEKQQGWDVSIQLPPLGSTPQRIVFLQFKLGKSRGYSRKANTIFPAGGGAASCHTLFGINNNSGCNQHEVLRNVALAAQVPHCALYVLPQFTDEAQVMGALGQLLQQTQFFSVPDVDALANPPIVTGKGRHIAIADADPRIREIRSQPKAFDAKDRTGELLGELAMIRIQRALEHGYLTTPFSPRRGQLIAAALVDFFAVFVGVDPSDAEQIFDIRLDRLGGTFSDGVSAPVLPSPLYAIALRRLQVIADVTLNTIHDFQSGRRPGFIKTPLTSSIFAAAENDEVKLRVDLDGDDLKKINLRYLVV